MGRWSGFKLQTNTNSYLNILTVYRPNISKGISTCYQQHLSIMKRKLIHNPDPRQQLLDDLATLIVEFNNNNEKSIILIDANESLYSNNSKIAPFLAITQMTSLIQNSQHHPATYARGSQCIDFIIGSISLEHHVTQSGIQAFFEQPWRFTDHRGLFIDIC